MARAFTATATGTVSGSPGALKGLSFRETSGTASARFRLFDGLGTGGQLIMDVTLNPNESTREWFGEEGIAAPRGLFFQLDSGAVNGAIWFRAGDAAVRAALDYAPSQAT